MEHGELTGPWQQAFWFELPVAIRSKSNKRYTGSTESKIEYKLDKAFERDVALMCRLALPHEWDLGPAPRSGKKLHERRPLVVSAIVAESELDAGNLSKSVLDACNGITYWDDSEVRSCLSLNHWGQSKDAWMAFALLPPGSSPAALLAAQTALAEELLSHSSL